MKDEEKERLARLRDWSDEAISWRLRAAETLSGKSQKEIACEIETKQTTLNSQIVKGRPSRELMRYFYRNHRIDFNFILHGDYVQLPGDVQDRLWAALSEQEQH